MRAIADVLVGGDFYSDEPIAAFAWPLLLQAGALARLDGARLLHLAGSRVFFASVVVVPCSFQAATV